MKQVFQQAGCLLLPGCRARRPVTQLLTSGRRSLPRGGQLPPKRACFQKPRQNTPGLSENPSMDVESPSRAGTALVTTEGEAASPLPISAAAHQNGSGHQ